MIDQELEAVSATRRKNSPDPGKRFAIDDNVLNVTFVEADAEGNPCRDRGYFKAIPLLVK